MIQLNNYDLLNIILSISSLIFLSFLNKHIKGYHAFEKLKNFLITMFFYSFLFSVINYSKIILYNIYTMFFLIINIIMLFLLYILDSTSFFSKNKNLVLSIVGSVFLMVLLIIGYSIA